MPFCGNPRSKFYWINREIFFLKEDGVLCRKEINLGRVTEVIPAILTNQIIEMSHDIPSSGHQGMIHTRQTVGEKYFWYELGELKPL